MLPLFGHARVYKVAGSFRDLTTPPICLAGPSHFSVSQYLSDDESGEIEFILKSKTWSSGPGQRRSALPSMNAMGYWNNGVLEY